MLIDKHARTRRHDPVFELKTFYGQLEHIVLIKFLNACPPLKIDAPTSIILAAIRTCNLDNNNEADEWLDIHYYSSLGALHVIDITSVQALVGRVKSSGNQWAIIDRSGSLARAIFEEDDDNV